MKTTLVFLAVLLAVGCGGGTPFQPDHECPTTLFARVYSETGDCQTIVRNENWVAGLLLDGYSPRSTPGVLNGDQLFGSFTDLTVWVHSSAWGLNEDPEALGAIHGDDLEVEAGTGALAHEMLHHFDQVGPRHLTEAQSASHPDWDALGYKALSKIDSEVFPDSAARIP